MSAGEPRFVIPACNAAHSARVSCVSTDEPFLLWMKKTSWSSASQRGNSLWNALYALNSRGVADVGAKALADVDDTVAAAKPNADPTPGAAASRRRRKSDTMIASAGEQRGNQPPEARRDPRRKVTIFSSCMGLAMPRVSAPTTPTRAREGRSRSGCVHAARGLSRFTVALGHCQHIDAAESSPPLSLSPSHTSAPSRPSRAARTPPSPAPLDRRASPPASPCTTPSETGRRRPR